VYKCLTYRLIDRQTDRKTDCWFY